ncbi:MAG TPA: hypothetical protein QF874_00575, partial [Pelagibacteraceae bacterium]|nr:hypothetical protein [Pelagibacteraceae bacterium]
YQMLSESKKINFLKNNYFFIIFFLGILFCHQIIFQQFFPNQKDLLGHDYEQFIPNLIFGKIWFKNNFLSIPWFTPSFCCGIPFYADPQTLYYSIPQIIFLIFDPVLSLKVTFFIFSLVAYVGMLLLLKVNFKFNSYIALLCASLFLFNGFFVYRAIAGPLLTHIFIPLYCFFLIQSYSYTDQSKHKLSFIYLILSSFVFANFFHSGSGSTILIILTNIMLILTFYTHFVVQSLKIFVHFIYSIFFGILISLSKITAVLFFLNNFPRHYPPTEFVSFFSFFKTFFLSFFIKPNEEYFNENITSMFPFGVHEMEYGLSVVPLIILFFIFFLRKNSIKFNYYNTRFLFLVITIFSIPIFMNINFINQYELIEKIPILKSTWVRFRWMSIYIIPIIILSGLVIKNLNFNISQKKYLAIFMVFVLLIQNFARDKSWHFNDQKYFTKNAIDFSLKIKTEKISEIIGPAVIMDQFGEPKKINYKNDLFFFSYSPILCYQPMFGYGLENLNMKKIVFNSKRLLKDNSYMLYSDKLDKKDGHFMFFNPSCFLFPKENNCLPGDTFKVSEKEKLVKFANYKKFEFKKNKFQKVANYVSIFTFMGCLLYLIYNFIIFVYNLRKKN